MDCSKSCTSSGPARTTMSEISIKAGSSIWSQAFKQLSWTLASDATAFCTSATWSRSTFAREDTIPVNRSGRDGWRISTWGTTTKDRRGKGKRKVIRAKETGDRAGIAGRATEGQMTVAAAGAAGNREAVAIVVRGD